MKRTKEKKCINCLDTFTVEYEMGDQGSLNSCKRKYCSSECKQHYVKFVKNNKKIEISCEQCGTLFYLCPSLSIKRKHCSKKCRAESNAKECPSCSSCKKSLKRKTKDGICFDCRKENNQTLNEINFENRQCEVCGAEWRSRITSKKKVRFCSRDCQWKGQSSGLVKIPTHGRMGFRVDLNDGNYYKSSLEADYARFCKFNNTAYLYESKTFTIHDGDKKRHYTPDFFLIENEEFVEVKGDRDDKKYDSNLACVEKLQKQNVKISIKLMSEFYSEIKDMRIKNIEGFDYAGTRGLITLSKDRCNRSCEC